MELFAIISAIVLLVILYFCFGMLIKFIWGWLPLLIGLVVGITIGILGGWSGAAIGLVIILGSIFATDSWHGTDLFLTVEESIEKKFHLND